MFSVAAMYVWGLLTLPPVSPSDLGAFPPFDVVRPLWRDVAKPAYEFHRDRHSVCRPREWAAARYHYGCWHLLDDAYHYSERFPASPTATRALESLRDTLGPEAYYSGRMPDPLPPGD